MLTTPRVRARMLTTPETHQPSLEARVSFVSRHCPRQWGVGGRVGGGGVFTAVHERTRTRRRPLPNVPENPGMFRI